MTLGWQLDSILVGKRLMDMCVWNIVTVIHLDLWTVIIGFDWILSAIVIGSW